ncbi:S41 family peptidase [Oscillatoriales cyanobacterium LEGE 11467]|uniref:S41 family peptidase n=1 Tax=Zarconia navalis LEGE 11467 TaxID=1828826 RepID=A0A928VXM3_9CYAN|nr:carboxyl-terminal processing protease CtpB [Zarconia navalis]MBE9041163.1 S41 family peptidase [Zarconia navalis LEGE 11467]
MNCSPIRSRLQRVALVGGAIATTSFSLLFPVGSRAVNAALQNSPKTVLDEVWQIVNRDYVDDSFNQVNWSEVRKELLSRDYTSRQQAYAAIRRALSQLNDPYTRFLDPEQFEALTDQTAGELSGIGLQLSLDERTQEIEALETIPNSPALRAGLQSGDRILEIDGQRTRGMDVERAAGLIRGEVGTSVTLKVQRGVETPFELTLVRSRIELPTVSYTIRQEEQARIGYIQLDEFNAHAAEQMYRALQDLNGENVDAFVLDLRGNPGGLLNISVEIARMWIDRGTIVSTVDRRGQNETIEATGMAMTDRPLAVLVDKNSASASEILAGALQDNGRGTIIGTQTFGKALVQAVNSLSDGSGLAVTIAHYYTPKGTDINKTGISPDITVQLTVEQEFQLTLEPQIRGTQFDPFYARAIDVLQTSTPVAAN